MLDGLSAEKLRSLNLDREYLNKKFAPENYLDEIIKSSLCFSNVYGAGETFASLSAKLTGEAMSQLKSDFFSHPRSFKVKENIASFIKIKYNFDNVFYRNYSDKYPTVGVYERYNNLCTLGFDRIILKDNSRIDLPESDVLKGNNNFFRNDNENNFIFIHDLHLHDAPNIYDKNGRMENYEKAIVDSANHLKRNLEYLHYDENKDMLIFSSDHGLTIYPELSMYYDESISKEDYLEYRKMLFSELKLRCFLAVKYKEFPPQMSSKLMTTQSVFDVVKSAINTIFNKGSVGDIINQYGSDSIITSVCDIAFGNPTPLWKRNTFHSHIVHITKKYFWVYSHWPERKLYHKCLDRIDELSEEELNKMPMRLKHYIDRYYSLSEWMSKGLFLSFIYVRNSASHLIFRQCKSLYSKLKKETHTYS